jgi:hypothetical protein
LRLPRLVLLAVLATALAGCSSGLPPLPDQVPPSATAPPTTAPASRSPLPRPTPSIRASSASGFPEDSAVTCAGRPGADQIVALLRARHVIDATATVTARQGPLCAGTWQYTVLAVANREPLQVVTQGPASALVLVTAGTDVCTAGVRAQAPPGITAAAHCGD